MMQFSRFDRVIKRQRHQALSVLITFAFFAGGLLLTVGSLAACAPSEDDQRVEAVAATLAALAANDREGAAAYLGDGVTVDELARFDRELRAAGGRYTVQRATVDGGDVLATITIDGTPLAARIDVGVGFDPDGRIRDWTVLSVERALLQ
jgi:hypothetical protein